MDLVWLLCGIGFLAGSGWVLPLIDSLRKERQS